MSCVKQTISAANPCRICGKPDYCYRLVFDTNETLHCCARISEKAVTSSYGTFIWKKSKDTSIGVYNYYQEESEAAESRKAFIESLKASGSYKGEKTSSAAKPKINPVAVQQAPLSVEGECPVASPEYLDRVYHFILDRLCLEDSDRSTLMAEWNTPATGDLTSEILGDYPIKSLPPDDAVRQTIKCHFISPLRSEVEKALYDEFGLIEGVPGVAHDGKSNHIIGGEGILFPLYDIQGRLIRLRNRLKYPSISGEMNGVKGQYIHFYSKYGSSCWSFKGEGQEEATLVYSSSKQNNLITLKPNGCPAGKASGKYKNFTSFAERHEGERIYNLYGTGTRSGSHVSIYHQDNASFQTVYVTEGEKKAIVASRLLHVPVISLPGTGTFSKLFDEDTTGSSLIDTLVKKGMRLLVIAYDADKSENLKVLQAEQKAVCMFLEKGIKIAIGEWNPAFGKGLDDILVAGIRPSLFICE